MYAETFKVGKWLEKPAQWLRWAMQANTAGNLKDTNWNLNQFWKALESLKGSAKGSKDWAEIMTLDAQSQLALGSYIEALISDLLRQKNSGNLEMYLGLLVPVLGPAIAADGYLTKEKVDSILPNLNYQKNQAYAMAEKMNTKSLEYYRDAKVEDNQAKNAKTVISNRINKQSSSDKATKDISKKIDGNTPQAHFVQTVKETVTMPVLGLPLWAWAAVGLGIVLMIPTGPTIQLRSAEK